MASNRLEETTSLLFKLVYPLFLIFGSFGNIMTIIVFSRMKYYSEMSTYYIALALSDLAVLYFGWLTNCWLWYQFDISIVCLHILVCKLLYAADYISSALSSWYLVVMTMQRAVSVVWPHRVKVVCTRNVSRVVTAFIAVVIIASYSHTLFEVTISIQPCYNSSCGTCNCGPFNKDYSYFQKYLLSWIDLVVASLAPSGLLLVSNIVIVRTLLTSARNIRHRLTAGQSAHVSARESKASSLSLTLIVLSVTFFILNGPFRVYLILYPYMNFNEDIEATNFTYYLLYLQSIASSTVNFYLYCLTGAKFRHQCANLSCGLLHKIRRK